MNESPRQLIEPTFRQEFIRRLFLPQVFWPLLFVAVAFVGLFGYRQAQLRGVPDIGEPFDVEALGYIEIHPAENAATEYEEALRLVQQNTPSERFRISDDLEKPWAEVDSLVKDWLNANAETLEVWRQGTTKNRYLSIQPAELALYWDDHNSYEIRDLARLAAYRDESAGNDIEAWRWHLAHFRYGCHLAMSGPSTSLHHGGLCEIIAISDIVRFVENEQIAAERFDVMLSELHIANQLDSDLSHVVIAEYFSGINHLSQLANVLEMYSKFAEVPEPATIFVKNEPELTRRLLQHQVANLLAYVDLQLADRPLMIAEDIHYFDAEIGDHYFLAANDFQSALGRSVLAEIILVKTAGLNQFFFRKQANQTIIELILAAQWYRRIHGEFPEALDVLVEEGMIESIPEDPMSYVHEPIRYRRDPENTNRATVWSVGDNHVDDGGLVEFVPGVGMLDLGFTIGEKVEAVSDTEPDVE